MTVRKLLSAYIGAEWTFTLLAESCLASVPSHQCLSCQRCRLLGGFSPTSALRQCHHAGVLGPVTLSLLLDSSLLIKTSQHAVLQENVENRGRCFQAIHFLQELLVLTQWLKDLSGVNSTNNGTRL